MRWSLVARTVVCVYTRVRSLPNVAARTGRRALEGGGKGRKVREGLMEAAGVACRAAFGPELGVRDEEQLFVGVEHEAGQPLVLFKHAHAAIVEDVVPCAVAVGEARVVSDGFVGVAALLCQAGFELRESLGCGVRPPIAFRAVGVIVLAACAVEGLRHVARQERAETAEAEVHGRGRVEDWRAQESCADVELVVGGQVRGLRGCPRAGACVVGRCAELREGVPHGVRSCVPGVLCAIVRYGEIGVLLPEVLRTGGRGDVDRQRRGLGEGRAPRLGVEPWQLVQPPKVGGANVVGHACGVSGGGAGERGLGDVVAVDERAQGGLHVPYAGAA